MGLETKTLAELEKLASNLRSQIARNPAHSAKEKVELEDVEGWIKLRRKEAKPGPRSDDDINAPRPQPGIFWRLTGGVRTAQGFSPFPLS
jgi:hypothetical protein